jgi:hypothetical protein
MDSWRRSRHRAVSAKFAERRAEARQASPISGEEQGLGGYLIYRPGKAPAGVAAEW